MLAFAIAAVAFASEPVTFVRAPIALQPRLLQVAAIPAPPPLQPTPAILHMTITPPAGAPYQITLTWVQETTSPILKGTWQGVGPMGRTSYFSAYDPNQLFQNPTLPNPASQLRAIWHGAGYMQVNSDSPYSAGPFVRNGYTVTVGP